MNDCLRAWGLFLRASFHPTYASYVFCPKRAFEANFGAFRGAWARLQKLFGAIARTIVGISFRLNNSKRCCEIRITLKGPYRAHFCIWEKPASFASTIRRASLIESICDDFSTIPPVFFVFFVFFVFREDYCLILNSYLQLRLHFGANLLHFGANLLHFGADLLHFGELSTFESSNSQQTTFAYAFFSISYILGLTSYILGVNIFKGLRLK